MTVSSPPTAGADRFAAGIRDTIEFFFGSWENFFLKRQGWAKSTVFRTTIFQPLVVALDLPAIRPLFEADQLAQDYGFGWAVPPKDLVGHVVPSIFETGPRHDTQKAFLLKLFETRGRQLPAVVERTFAEHADRWSRQANLSFEVEAERFALAILFRWLLETEIDVDRVRDLYNNIFLHPLPWLERWIPGSSYRRSLAYYPEYVAHIDEALARSDIPKIADSFGLSRDELPHRFGFLLGMNGYLGLQSFIKSIIGEIDRNPTTADMLREELCAASPAEVLSNQPLDRFLREVLRLHPPVYFIFGRALADLVISSTSGSFALRRGELLMGVIPFAQAAAGSDRDLTFDPGRHAREAAHDSLIWPRGKHDAPVVATDRACTGKDAALTIGKLVCHQLLVKCRWTLKEPARWSRDRFTLNAAAPVGALTVDQFRIT